MPSILPPISHKGAQRCDAYTQVAQACTRTTAAVVVPAGVSAQALQLADSAAYIPMSGFVSSFNVSVAAALVLYEARRGRLEKLGRHGDLSDAEKQVLMAVLLLRQQVSSLLRLKLHHWNSLFCNVWLHAHQLVHEQQRCSDNNCCRVLTEQAAMA